MFRSCGAAPVSILEVATTWKGNLSELIPFIASIVSNLNMQLSTCMFVIDCQRRAESRLRTCASVLLRTRC